MKVKLFFSQKESLIFALEEIKEVLYSSFKDFDFLLFSFHPKYDYTDINYFVNKVFQTDKWIGFHAVDAFYNDMVIEGIVALAVKFEREGNVKVFEVEDIGQESALSKTADYLQSNKDKLNIIIGGLCEHRLGFFIEDLSKMLKYYPVNNIVGGLASGFEKDGEVLTFIFTPDKIIKNGFVVLSFENLEYSVGISLGFKPYGITYEITHSEGYKIYSVDDGKNFSYLVQNLLKEIENPSVDHLWYCPINIIDDKEGYVATLRTPKKIDKDYVEFFGPVKNGQRFKFSFGDKDEILEEDKKVALMVKNQIKHPDLIFNFSCIARQYALEDKKQQESQVYLNTLNSYLFGFFTFGEIGPDKFFKSLKFYNETSLLLGVKEK